MALLYSLQLIHRGDRSRHGQLSTERTSSGGCLYQGCVCEHVSSLAKQLVGAVRMCMRVLDSRTCSACIAVMGAEGGSIKVEDLVHAARLLMLLLDNRACRA